MLSKGFVAIFSVPLTRELISEFVQSWLERFEKVEQVMPIGGEAISTLQITTLEELMWEENLQFRVLNGQEFSWVYATLNQRAMETTGLASGPEEISLCLDVLLELPGVVEIVDTHNEKRLDQLEKEGLL